MCGLYYKSAKNNDRAGDNMPYFPMFIDLKGMNCLIVGGGKTALRKIRVLCDFGAVIKVVAKEICEEIKEICRINKNVTYEKKAFSEQDLEGICLVVAATSQKELNHAISVMCRQKNIYINVVDQIEDCSFIFPSYVKENSVVGAFSTGGKSPVITQYLKESVKKSLTPFIGELADFLGSIRTSVKENTQTEEERKKIYQRLLKYALDFEKIPDETDISKIIKLKK